MNTAPFIARLQAQCPGFKFVGGVLDLDDSTLQAVQYPAAFVVPLSETAEPSGMLGRHQQRLTQNWAVVLALRSIRTATRDNTDELDTLRQSVRSAIAGWCPDNATQSPANFTGGQLIDASGSALLWQDDYTLQAHFIAP